MIPLLITHLAYAGSGEPSDPVVHADSSISTDVLIHASVADVRAVLADPKAAGALSDSVLAVRVLGKDGPCDLVEVTCKGVMDPLTYTVRRCPTPTGFSENLVQSEDFSSQRAEWRLEPVSGGTLVTFSVRSEPKISLPRRVVQAVVESSAVETLENLVRRVTGR